MDIIPYTCCRCGYKIKHKSCMIKHLYKRNKDCPGTVNDIELTDEIKEKILLNRIYKIPTLIKTEKKEKKEKNEKRDKSELAKLPDNEYYNYIYLLRPEESVLNKNNIYKIGMSVVKEKSCNITRLSSYRVGSELIFVCQCVDAHKMESEILKVFNNEFKRAYGNEYFIGNKYEMIKIIGNILELEEKNNNESNDTNDTIETTDSNEIII